MNTNCKGEEVNERKRKKVSALDKMTEKWIQMERKILKKGEEAELSFIKRVMKFT